MGTVVKLMLESDEQSKWEPKANRKREVLKRITEISDIENREHPSNQNYFFQSIKKKKNLERLIEKVK